MKNSLYRFNFPIFSPSLAAFACLLLASNIRADQTWGGGDGQWDVNHTADWSGSTWSEGYDTATGTFPNPGDIADFTTTGGTVTVDDSQAGGSVGSNYLYFDSTSGAYTLTGDTVYTDGSAGLIVYDNGAQPVTINNNITVAGGGSGQFIANEGTGGLLTLNGTITYGQSNLNINNDGGGTTVINGTVNANGSTLTLATNGGSAGVYEFGAHSNLSSLGGANALSLNVEGGTALLDADTFLSTSTMEIDSVANDSIHGILTNGAFTGTQFISDERATGMVGGNAAVASGWSGGIYLDNGPSTITLSQVAGGRFTYNGGGGLAGTGIQGTNGTYLVTSGGGTVVLAGQNTYSGNNTLAADLQAARTLITNPLTGGSAFGTGTGVVQVEAHKLLGGTGFSSQQVVAMDASSIITAGDPGDASLGIFPTIGALTLNGGLVANTGVTFDFKLDSSANSNPGIDNDSITLGDLTLNGLVTVNITSVDGGVVTGSPYTFMKGNNTSTWTAGNDLSFKITAPAGYEVDSSYGTDGYDFETTDSNSFSVQFVAAPEPSTYALICVGLLTLFAWAKRRKLGA
jgi:hypothetical protein